MRGLQMFVQRFAVQPGLDPNVPPHGAGTSHGHAPPGGTPFVYRIRVDKKTGRFERPA